VELDEGLDRLATDGIGGANRRRQGDRRMAVQSILDLARTDPIAAARDEIVFAADEPAIAVGVLSYRSPS
jgi:hypothetical protein